MEWSKVGPLDQRGHGAFQEFAVGCLEGTGRSLDQEEANSRSSRRQGRFASADGLTACTWASQSALGGTQSLWSETSSLRRWLLKGWFAVSGEWGQEGRKFL